MECTGLMTILIGDYDLEFGPGHLCIALSVDVLTATDVQQALPPSATAGLTLDGICLVMSHIFVNHLNIIEQFWVDDGRCWNTGRTETAASFQDGRRLRCNVVSLPGPKGPPPSIPPQAAG